MMESDILYLNEINVIPGSLSYYLFEPTFSCPTILIQMAIKSYYKKSLKLNSFKSNVLSTIEFERSNVFYFCFYKILFKIG